MDNLSSLRSWKCNHNEPSPREYTTEGGKNAYFMRLCTVFVATIEETKDRISQLELIFCSQLFPAFQFEISESRNVIKKLEKLLKDSTEEWEDAKRALMQRLKELQAESDSGMDNLSQRQERLGQEQQLLCANSSGTDESQQRRIKEMEELLQKNQQILREYEERQNNLDKLLHEAEDLQNNCDKLRLENAHLCHQYKEVSLANTSLKEASEKIAQEKEETLQSLKQVSLEKEALQHILQDTLQKTEITEEKHWKDKDKVEDPQWQILSAQLEKEKKARQCVTEKFQLLRKCHKNLKRQYNVLFDQKGYAISDGRMSLHVTDDSKKVTNPLAKGMQRNKIFLKEYLHSDDSSAGRCQEDQSPCGIASTATNKQVHDSFTAPNVDGERKLSPNSEINAYCPKDEEMVICSENMNTAVLLGNRDHLQQTQSFAVLEEDCVDKQSLSNRNQLQQVAAKSDSPFYNEMADSFSKGKQHSCFARSPSPESQSVNKSASSSQHKDGKKEHEHQENYQKIEISEKDSDGSLAASLAKSGQSSVHKRTFSSRTGPHASKGLKVAWRNTRLRSDVKGPDPHDDFLNTPFENAIKCVADQTEGKSIEKSELQMEVQTEQISPERSHLFPNKLSKNCATRPISDAKAHATECMSTKPSEGTSASAATALKVGHKAKQGTIYKYVEPVRKKDERENLQGIECNQCRKFYDAILAEDGEAVLKTRCEHHDGVSRHRYRYIPPATPEGFWNIGFDTEL